MSVIFVKTWIRRSVSSNHEGDPEFSSKLEHVLIICFNLFSFRMLIPRPSSSDEDVESDALGLADEKFLSKLQ